MNTPICDFLRRYAEKNALRLHMPGHKGKGFLGAEKLDITEIEGADSLYEAKGIIAQSEENAGKLFGADTFYSTEGSSHCIRAMLHLAVTFAKSQNKKPLIVAARNVHKAFLSAAALLDFEIFWLYSKNTDSYLSCKITAEELDRALSLSAEKPTAVYITSPDYLGNLADIKALSLVCKKHGVLLLVDNAHGAYLNFLNPSLHPMDLGADLCCDSAHKTLPVLTGGAYLHISKNAPDFFKAQAKNALALFGSTSPSYLILQSLDKTNAYLSDGYCNKLWDFALKVQTLKKMLVLNGYATLGDEPLKITLCTKPYGYTGTDFAKLLLNKNIVPEFADPDFVVLMFTPEIGDNDLKTLEAALCAAVKKSPIKTAPPPFAPCKAAMSVRCAALSPCETIKAQNSAGRILAAATVACPPAVPIVVCGEIIDENALKLFEYYGIKECTVVK
ncbi:MAG: aminotransferase class V-fold PLP-dependent enzyme [Clostridia bacterium]|nr:aminotransferase class V-fold PLP-dependent enzyme [Clostridia bacterium]